MSTGEYYLLIGGDRVVGSLAAAASQNGSVAARAYGFNAHCIVARSIASSRAVMQCRAIYEQLFHESFLG